LASNVSPIDVIAHLPVLCEESGNLLVYVTAKETLGLACDTKRSTSCVFIPNEFEELSDKIKNRVKKLTSEES